MASDNNNNQVFLTPDYMTKFKCIGKNCIDSCCTGFNIEIDEETFNQYKNSSENKINLISEQYIVKKKNRSKISFAKIEKKENSCAFLSDQKLCNAYSILGKEHLSIGCATFPRVIKKSNKISFISGELSCPEVSKLCLSNPNISIMKLRKKNILSIIRKK